MTKENNFFHLFLILVFVVLLFFLLKIGADLIRPFIIALLFSFAIIALADSYKKIPIGKWRLPGFFAMLFSLGTYIVIFWLLGRMLGSQIQDVIALLPSYQAKMNILYINMLEYLHIPENMDLYSVFQKIDIPKLVTMVVSSVTDLFSKIGIILFYMLFILLEYRYFGEKIQKMCSSPTQSSRLKQTLQKIEADVKSYFVIKAFVSIVTGLLSYMIMRIMGLDFALFWALGICLLNFIPNIGSIIAVSFPIVLSLIQYETIYPFFIITIGLIAVQIVMSSIIEPKFMGNKLNLSPLVILIALGFWGAMWWVTGMLLSVPLMVIINIIFSRFEATRPLAILLSEKWELEIQTQPIIDEVKKSLKKIQKGRK